MDYDLIGNLREVGQVASSVIHPKTLSESSLSLKSFLTTSITGTATG